MQNQIYLYDTQIRQDEQGRFCLNDLHQASGGESRHRPAYWLSNQQTQELIGEISKDGIPSIFIKQGLGTFVSKELVYAYAMWISPKFHLYVIRTFDSLVSHQNSTALLPQNYLQALEKLVETEKEKQALELENQVMKPKADFVDLYVDIGTTKSLRETAKILNMPEKAMIAALERDKALYRQSGNLIPYSDKQSRGLFTVKTGTAEHGHNFTQTRVTSKGIQWIAQRYASELVL